MSRTRPTRPDWRWLGSAAAALALCAQLVFGGMLPAAGLRAASSDPLLGLATLCHAGPSDETPGPSPRERDPDCALCPLCLGVTAVYGILTPPPSLPLPAPTFVTAVSVPPPARAPPAPAARPAFPRGPPVPA